MKKLLNWLMEQAAFRPFLFTVAMLTITLLPMFVVVIKSLWMRYLK
jgi:hypothetical protein